MMTAQTVLIVDDSAAIRELFTIAFTQAGFNVVSAENGQQAIQILRTQHIDVMTLDHDMPLLSGLGVLRTLKETPCLDHTKVIFVTANDGLAFDELVVEFADLVLLKPVSFSQLIQLASRLLMQHKATA
ncbi:MAG: response regulator [Chloroflexota bacterium]